MNCGMDDCCKEKDKTKEERMKDQKMKEEKSLKANKVITETTTPEQHIDTVPSDAQTVTQATPQPSATITYVIVGLVILVLGLTAMQAFQIGELRTELQDIVGQGVVQGSVVSSGIVTQSQGSGGAGGAPARAPTMVGGC